MKKLFKMRNLLAASMAAVMCLSFAGCSGNGGGEKNDAGVAVKEDTPKGKKITLYQDTYEDKDLKISADFYYPEDADIEILEQSPERVELKWPSQNITIELFLNESSTFDDNKASRQEREKDFTEYKIQDYDAYGYKYGNGYECYIHLEELTENTDRWIEVKTWLLKSATEAPEGKAQIEMPEIKKMLETFVFNGIVDAPATIVDEWEVEDGARNEYTFWADGTGTNMYDGGYTMFTYTDNGDSVSITLKGEETATEHAYRIEKNKLYFTDKDGNELIFVRQ